jgi:hypothetical protein
MDDSIDHQALDYTGLDLLGFALPCIVGGTVDVIDADVGFKRMSLTSMK